MIDIVGPGIKVILLAATGIGILWLVSGGTQLGSWLRAGVLHLRSWYSTTFSPHVRKHRRLYAVLTSSIIGGLIGAYLTGSLIWTLVFVVVTPFVALLIKAEFYRTNAGGPIIWTEIDTLNRSRGINTNDVRYHQSSSSR